MSEAVLHACVQHADENDYAIFAGYNHSPVHAAEDDRNKYAVEEPLEAEVIQILSLMKQICFTQLS